MQIASISETDHADFLALINAEIRPHRAKTNAWDDFPLILSSENRFWSLGAFTAEGYLAAGIACLIREFATSCGILQIAGIGSVVTKPEFRGQGLSTSLQNEMLNRLQRNNVPLAVLWTDKPEIYAGRGFISAGYEFHVDFTDCDFLVDLPEQYRLVGFKREHVASIEKLYCKHPYHCFRKATDSQRLYCMAGTKGLVVLDQSDQVKAYAFCGKGGDFPLFVPEWGGETPLVLHLLKEARNLGWANKVLVPAGAFDLAESLVNADAEWQAQPSGYWKVVNKEAMEKVLGELQMPIAQGLMSDPVALLGKVDGNGLPEPGLVELAVWGFDSV